MKRMLPIQPHLHRIAALAPVLLLAACTLEIVQTSATEAPAAWSADAVIPPYATAAGLDPTLTATFAEPTPTATVGWPSAEPLPTVTVTQPPALPGGEWLMVTSAQGLWMSRADGSQAGIRIAERIVPEPLANAHSPAGGLLAYLTATSGSEAYGDYRNLTLHVISLRGVGASAVIPLTSPATEPGIENPTSIVRAITEQPSLAWSPDGGRLAFIGAQAGTSADLYEYYRADGRVVQLTDGPDQAYRPLWSPDGKWIVHGAAGSFGSGAGYGVTGFYAARADDGGIISLYDIGERSGDEVGAGWLDEHTLVAHSWTAVCGSQNLRLVDLSAQTAEMVFDGCMDEVAVGHGSALFGQSLLLAEFDENPRPGLYLITSADRRPRQISSGDIERIEWVEEIGAFLAVTSDFGILEVSPAGQIRVLAGMASRVPIVSPGGRWWAYYQMAQRGFSDTDGIFAGGYGQGMWKIFDGSVASGRLIFSPDGDSLYFVTASGDLYRAQAPNWAPVVLASGLKTDPYYPTDMAWCEG